MHRVELLIRDNPEGKAELIVLLSKGSMTSKTVKYVKIQACLSAGLGLELMGFCTYPIESEQDIALQKELTDAGRVRTFTLGDEHNCEDNGLSCFSVTSVGVSPDSKPEEKIKKKGFEFDSNFFLIAVAVLIGLAALCHVMAILVR